MRLPAFVIFALSCTLLFSHTTLNAASNDKWTKVGTDGKKARPKRIEIFWSGEAPKGAWRNLTPTHRAPERRLQATLSEEERAEIMPFSTYLEAYASSFREFFEENYKEGVEEQLQDWLGKNTPLSQDLNIKAKTKRRDLINFIRKSKDLIQRTKVLCFIYNTLLTQWFSEEERSGAGLFSYRESEKKLFLLWKAGRMKRNPGVGTFIMKDGTSLGSLYGREQRRLHVFAHIQQIMQIANRKPQSPKAI